jgi:hypothetical protein
MSLFDWTVRDNVRAHLRVRVKRILRKYGYPPNRQEQATQIVMEQAEVLSRPGRRLGRFYPKHGRAASSCTRRPQRLLSMVTFLRTVATSSRAILVKVGSPGTLTALSLTSSAS